MASWFGDLPTPPVLATSGGTSSSLVQALRGVGDQDDSANLPVSLGDAADPNASVFHWFACSASNSAHFMYVTCCRGSSVPQRIVLGITPENAFESTTPAGVQWSQLSGETIQLGFPAALAVAVVDLDEIYDSDTASVVHAAIGAATLSADQELDLYAQVIGYSYPALTSFAYELMDVEFPDPPLPGAGRKQFIGSSYVPVVADESDVHHVSISGTITNTMSLSSGETWGAGVEVGFSMETPFAGVESKLTGSFEHQNGEVAETTVDMGLTVSDDLTLQPGNWKVTAYANMADSYTAAFSGTLRVTGMVAAPGAGVTAHPLNGSVLTAIMANPERNEGCRATPFTAGPDLTSAPVSGVVRGSFAYTTSLETTRLPDGAAS
jgi:hypothetical protein